MPKSQKLLRKNYLGQSMSIYGNYWYNILQEFLFSHMKNKITFKLYLIFEDEINKIDNYIDYYNNHRCQCTLKNMTLK